jgi:2-polyprenyl-3-methyl-5-hydroxy-6-metoxy-1,4-benzoquinol methylase
MIEIWSEGLADDNMDQAILVELGEIVHAHPWWRARTRLTLALLDRLGIHPPSRVLDAGCGWGSTLFGLERASYRVVGADISRRALEQLDRADRSLAVADLTQPLPDGIEPFDAALALDVIEHIDDDQGALARLRTLLRPGGTLVVSVPALPDLFSAFDAIQGHRRRYVPETLRAAFNGSGLRVESIFWWGRWLVPVLQRQRRRPKAHPSSSPAEAYREYLKLPPWPAPWLLGLAFRLEQHRALRRSLKSGTSLFAVARRDSDNVRAGS